MNNLILKNTICFLIFFFSCFSSSAQFANKKYYLIDSLDLSQLSEKDKLAVDSLLKVYHGAKTDSVRIRSLLSLAFLEDLPAGFNYNRVLLAETKKILDSKRKTVGEKFLNRIYGKGIYNISYYYSEQNNEDSSLKYLRMAIEPLKKAGAKSDLSDTYNAIGASLGKKGKIKESIKYYQLSLALSEAAGDKAGIAFAYMSMGHVYRDVEEFDKAIEKFNKALKMFEETNDGENIADTWNYLGVVYKWKKDSAAALKAYENSLKKSQEIGYKYGIATGKLNIGIDLLYRKNYTKAINYFEQSLSYFKNTQNPNGVVYCLSNLADAYNALEQYEKSILYGKEALDIAKQIGYPESILRSSEVLQKAFRKHGLYKEALETMDLYHAIADSLKSAETQRASLKAQMEFDRQKEVFELKKEQESINILAAEDKKRLNIIIWGTMVGLILLSVFSVIIYRSLQKNKNANKIITMQKHVVEEKQKEILDSIHYAKRIQQSLLPTEKYIEKSVKKLKSNNGQ
jgi:tetratricopeptide (TPR) repeat protein